MPRATAFERAFRLIQKVPDAVVVSDESFRVVGWNDGAVQLYGIAATDTLGLRIDELITLEELPLTRSALRRHVKKHGNWRGECVHVSRAGRRVWVDWTISSLQADDDGLDGSIAIAKDITARIENERARAGTEARLSTLFEAMADGIVYHDAAGIVVDANPAALRFLGLTLDQLRGLTSLNPRWKAIRLDGSPFPGHEHPAIVALRTGKPVRETIMGIFHPGDNRHRWAIVSAVPEFEPGQSRPYQITVSITDVTETRAAQEKQERSDRRFTSLFNAMAEGVALHEVLYDEQGRYVNYRIIDVNPQYEAITTIPRARALGMLAHDLYGTPTPPYLDEFCSVAEPGRTGWLETYFPPMDKHFAISIAGLAHGEFATIFFDVTQRKRTEAALEAEKERLAVTLRSIGDGVISTDTAGRVVLINRAAEALTGWPQTEAMGRPLPEVFRIVHESTRQPRENPVDKVLRTGAVVELANHTVLLGRDGTEHVVADSGAPIRDRESQVVGVVLVFRDITTESRMQNELQRTAKLESLGVLAGGIAHDFNNLLTAIAGNMGLGQLALREGTLDKTSHHLSEAEQAAIRARDLTQQLLTFSKGGAPVRSLLDLAPLLHESARFALTGSRNRCRVEADVLWQVNADEGQLRQVLHNLLLNADQAMPVSGEIVLRATNRMLAPGSEVPLPAGPYVAIAIADKGIGIPAEILPRIFDPFFTTKQRGSGLGLASVYSIVRSHDGTIIVESTVGQGSTFTFFVPAMPEARGAAADDHARAPDVTGLHILVMEDEYLVRTMLRDSLRAMRHIVVDVPDSRSAIEAYERALREGPPFDLVILDLTIQGGPGGREVAEALRRLDPNVRAIASSGYATDPIMANFSDFGFVARLAKPYRLAELRTVLATVLQRSPR